MTNNKKNRKRILSVAAVVLMAFIAFNISVFAADEASLEGDFAAKVVEIEEPAVKADNLADPDTLLERYIEEAGPAIAQGEMMSKSTTETTEVKPHKSARYWKLSDEGRRAYKEIWKMLDSVSGGKSTEASVSFPFEKVFNNVILNYKFTAAELGVSSLGTYDKATGKFDTSAEAKNAINKKYSFEIEKVIRALLSDYPQLLYWYNKTEGVGFSVQYSYCTESEEVLTLWCDGAKSKFSFYFTVSKDYAPDVCENDYTVDTGKITSINSAIENAKKIINDSNNYTDYNKLKKYKDSICGLVSYNYKAAKDEQFPYGNPWQFIYVFDGDPTTNVVCEGYSKAFKYLCDKSVFSDENFSCNIVSGEMKSSGERDRKP